jgi:hypothetical protein
VNSSRFTAYGIVQPARDLRERRNKWQGWRSEARHNSAPNVDRPDVGSKALYQGVSVPQPGLERGFWGKG